MEIDMDYGDKKFCHICFTHVSILKFNKQKSKQTDGQMDTVITVNHIGLTYKRIGSVSFCSSNWRNLSCIYRF